MSRLVPLAAIAAFALATAAPGTAGSPKPGWPVTVGERGQRVCDVLTLLHGYKPSRFHGNPRFAVLKGPIPTRPSRCVYTRAASRATSVLKYREGYNRLFLGGQFGRKLFRYTIKGDGALLRTLAMQVIAGKRVQIDAAQAAAAKKAAAKLAWIPKLIGVEQHEVGVHEIPDGSNYSPRIGVYQRVTGAFRAAWCMSFQQWGRAASGMNTIASRSAGVFAVVDYARRHGLISSVPHPGDLAAFVDGLGHIGLVYKVTTAGYSTVEGNHSNSVADVFHPHHSRSVVFITAGPDAPTA